MPRGKRPAHYYQPPQPETITLSLTIPPGDTLSRKLYYSSESWISILYSDIDALLTSFADKWSDRIGGPDELSPFEVFKLVWSELGWAKVHLLGVLDGPLRRDWTESVLRAFLRNLKPDKEALTQVGSIFAIYTLYFTQAHTLEKTHILVDVAALDYIGSLPEILAPSLSIPASKMPEGQAPVEDLEISTGPSIASLDVHQVVMSLLARNAFFIIPSEAYLFPHTPSVAIRDGNESQLQATAKLVIGAEEEIAMLASSKLNQVAGEDTERDTEYSEVEKGWDERAGWNGNLRGMQENYLLDRRRGFPITSSHEMDLDTSDSSGSKGIRKRKREEKEIRKKTLSLAQNMTLAALKDAGTAAEGIIPEIATLGDAEGLSLFDLVGREEGPSFAARKGLIVFEKALSEFTNAQV